MIIRQNSEQIGDKWIPKGLIIFTSKGAQTEHVDTYYDIKFDTKKEADQFFIKTSNKKYDK